MFIDSNNIQDKTIISSDICIVGSGPAGIVVADSLSSQDLSITLLESGGLEGETYTQGLNEGDIIGQDPGYDLEMSRLRLFGGTSNHWAGSNQKLDPIDFENREWVPYSGWPIKYEEVLKYYNEATIINEVPDLIDSKYEFFKDDNIVKYIKLFKKKYNKDIDIVTNHINPLMFVDKYYSKFKKQNNLKVLLHSTALKFNVSDFSKINSIEAVTASKKKLLIKSKYFIIAMGGIENARFLLLNLDKIPYESYNDKPLNGRFFQEHYGFTAGTLLLHQNVAEFLNLEKNFSMKNRLETETFFIPSEITQKNEKILNCRITLYNKKWNSLYSPYDIDLNLLKSDLYGYLRDFISSMEGPFEWFRNKSNFLNKPQRVFIGLEQAPNPNSRIFLIDKFDDNGQRKVALDWRLSEIDELSIKNITNWFSNSMGTHGLGRIRLGDDIKNIYKENFSSPIAGGYHHMGTTRMGLNSNSSVVDENCKYHQLNNLYIAGSSVFPTSGSTNPTFTIVALARRLADHIVTRF